MAQRYAMRDLYQAKRYLADPILYSRSRQDVRLLIGYKDKSAFEIFGSPDDLTLGVLSHSVCRSSLEQRRPSVVRAGLAPIL